MTMKKRILMSLLCFALILVLGGGNFLSAFFVKAEAVEIPGIATSDPLEDLEGATVAGQAFDIANYPFTTQKSPAVLTLLEYGCDLKENENLELYIYVYNPKGSTFIYSEYNLVSMRLCGDKSAPFDEYLVELVNFSQDANHYGKIYKYRIVLSVEQRAALCKQERVYELSELQLVKKETSGGTVPETIPCISKYTYSGFAAGVTQEGSSSSLECVQENSEAVSLEVKFAIFRPDNPISAEQKTTQASLHSVYFAVPRRYQNDYGNITRIRGSWKDAKLKPSLVIGDEAAYNDAVRFSCVDVDALSNDANASEAQKPIYAFGTNLSFTKALTEARFSGNMAWGFRLKDLLSYSGHSSINNKVSSYYNKIFLLFGTNFINKAGDSADDWTVSGDEIKRKVEEASARLLDQGHTETIGLNKYSAELFEEGSVVDRVLDVTSDTEFDLKSTIITQSWWQKLWGTYSAESADFDGIEGIKVLNDSDFTGNAEEAAKKLFVSDGDYGKLLDYYLAHKDDYYVYLVRYDVSEYYSEEAEIVGCFDNAYYTLLCDSNGNISQSSGLNVWIAHQYLVSPSNAYFFQETINLDFNIIDLTFTADGKDTVVPVIMTPQDFFPDATPPLETEDSIRTADWDWIMFLVRLFAVGLIVFLFILLWDRFLKPFLKLCWQGITFFLNLLIWPFRMLASWMASWFDKK